MLEHDIYVASSWKNEHFDYIIKRLIKEFPDHLIYNFKETNASFGFEQLPEYKNHTIEDYIKCFQNPYFKEAFNNDFGALYTSDICLLILPCGSSAHLELGYACGKDKLTIIFNPVKEEYKFELMEYMAKVHTDDMSLVIEIIRRHLNRIADCNEGEESKEFH